MEALMTQPFGDCFKAQRTVVSAANELSRQLNGVHPDADLLRLGATCLRLGAEKALQARDARTAIRSLHECFLGEKQIRLATYHALRDGCLENEIYDEMFRLCSWAARVREFERQTLRRRLQFLDIV